MNPKNTYNQGARHTSHLSANPDGRNRFLIMLDYATGRIIKLRLNDRNLDAIEALDSGCEDEYIFTELAKYYQLPEQNDCAWMLTDNPECVKYGYTTRKKKHYETHINYKE